MDDFLGFQQSDINDIQEVVGKLMNSMHSHNSGNQSQNSFEMAAESESHDVIDDIDQMVRIFSIDFTSSRLYVNHWYGNTLVVVLFHSIDRKPMMGCTKLMPLHWN